MKTRVIVVGPAGERALLALAADTELDVVRLPPRAELELDVLVMDSKDAALEMRAREVVRRTERMEMVVRAIEVGLEGVKRAVADFHRHAIGPKTRGLSKREQRARQAQHSRKP